MTKKLSRAEFGHKATGDGLQNEEVLGAACRSSKRKLKQTAQSSGVGEGGFVTRAPSCSDGSPRQQDRMLCGRCRSSLLHDLTCAFYQRNLSRSPHWHRGGHATTKDRATPVPCNASLQKSSLDEISKLAAGLAKPDGTSCSWSPGARSGIMYTARYEVSSQPPGKANESQIQT